MLTIFCVRRKNIWFEVVDSKKRAMGASGAVSLHTSVWRSVAATQNVWKLWCIIEQKRVAFLIIALLGSADTFLQTEVYNLSYHTGSLWACNISCRLLLDIACQAGSFSGKILLILGEDEEKTLEKEEWLSC